MKPRLTCRSCSRTYSGSQTEKWDLELSERSGWRSMISVNVKWPVRSSGWVDHLKPGRERSVFPHISGEKGPAQRNKDYERSLWREVDLLRNISHVRIEMPWLIPAHQMFSPMFYTLNVSSFPTKTCMSKFSLSCC